MSFGVHACHIRAHTRILSIWPQMYMKHVLILLTIHFILLFSLFLCYIDCAVIGVNRRFCSLAAIVSPWQWNKNLPINHLFYLFLSFHFRPLFCLLTPQYLSSVGFPFRINEIRTIHISNQLVCLKHDVFKVLHFQWELVLLCV